MVPSNWGTSGTRALLGGQPRPIEGLFLRPFIVCRFICSSWSPCSSGCAWGAGGCSRCPWSAASASRSGSSTWSRPTGQTGIERPWRTTACRMWWNTIAPNLISIMCHLDQVSFSTLIWIDSLVQHNARRGFSHNKNYFNIFIWEIYLLLPLYWWLTLSDIMIHFLIKIFPSVFLTLTFKRILRWEKCCQDNVEFVIVPPECRLCSTHRPSMHSHGPAWWSRRGQLLDFFLTDHFLLAVTFLSCVLLPLFMFCSFPLSVCIATIKII